MPITEARPALSLAASKIDLAPVKPSPLLGRWEFEVADLHRRTAVGRCLP